MPRRPRHAPLRVLMDDRLVGHLLKEPSGAIAFRYDPRWLEWQNAQPVSLSMPLREDAFRGETVSAVFDNLLPDSEAIRRRVAEKVGAAGADTYSLLAAIGRDCVGALQFLAGEHEQGEQAVSGETVNEAAIERLLKGLAQAPLGLSRDDDFRISVAGAQEKTALLRQKGKWLKPHGTTPTTHILKKQIGTLPNGIDLSNSVENEYYCLKLAAAFGLPVAKAEIMTFGETTALVVERFDRRWTKDGRLLRLAQEDCCQALAVPPTRKYQSDGGPSLKALLDLMDVSDVPAVDRAMIFKAQILFWLIGATDGHAKNFSIFLRADGTRLTPLYDVLTAQPSLDAGQIQRKQMRLALSVGSNRHYQIDKITRRHFEQSGEESGLPKVLVRNCIDTMADQAATALNTTENALPKGFPPAIHESVRAAVLTRAGALRS